MKKEYALEALAFELPLPGDQAGQKRRKNGERRERKVEVTSSRKVSRLVQSASRSSATAGIKSAIGK